MGMTYFFLHFFWVTQACFASLVSQDYVNGTDQEEIRTGKNLLSVDYVLTFSKLPNY